MYSVNPESPFGYPCEVTSCEALTGRPRLSARDEGCGYRYKYRNCGKIIMSDSFDWHWEHREWVVSVV